MRYLHIVFEVMDSPAAAALTTADLYDIGERIVADIDPDPPVLTFEGFEVVDVD